MTKPMTVDEALAIVASYSSTPRGCCAATICEYHQAFTALRARLAEQREELMKVRENFQEIINCLGPNPPDCGCSGCKVEMQMALDEARDGAAALDRMIGGME